MSKVVIAGEPPLAEELMELCAKAGHEVALYFVESLADADTARQLTWEAGEADVLVECHNESRTGKRRLLELVGAGVPLSREAIAERGARPGDQPVLTGRQASPGRRSPLRLICAQACSTTEAASWLPEPETACGWSLIPPLKPGDTVEVARGLRTADETLARAVEFWKGLGLVVEEVADGPGLVRARVLACLINEAADALFHGVASAADIDTAMQLGTNYPRGLLAWGDLIGLDTVLGIMRGLHEEYGDDRYRPSPLLARHVQAGWVGKKAGRGFFEYG